MNDWQVDEKEFCIAVFNIKSDNDKIISITDTDAELLKMTKKDLVIKSNRYSISKELLDSVSLTLIRFANVMIFINTKVKKIEISKDSCIYYLKIPFKSLFLPNEQKYINLTNTGYQKFLNLANAQKKRGDKRNGQKSGNNEPDG